MTNSQFRLNDIVRDVGVPYHWLAYRIATGQTPVKKKIAYSRRDVEILRRWVQDEGETTGQETQQGRQP
jgi:hypothetical protein